MRADAGDPVAWATDPDPMNHARPPGREPRDRLRVWCAYTPAALDVVRRPGPFGPGVRSVRRPGPSGPGSRSTAGKSPRLLVPRARGAARRDAHGRARVPSRAVRLA